MNPVIFGVIGNDIHVVSNRLMEKILEENKIFFINLGVSVSPEVFLDSALETQAAAILISSINGEAENWCINFPKLVKKLKIPKILLYIGGNLSLGDNSAEKVEKKFINFGFNRAYHQKANFTKFLNDLKRDLIKNK